jgi:lysophospholipase L1-like esterase
MVGRRLLVRVGMLSTIAVATVAAAPAVASATPVPCTHIKGTHRYNCSFYPAGDGISAGTPVVNAAGHRVGYLNQGTNYIYCQQVGGEVHSGQFFNKWWAYTKANDKQFGWVNAIYAHGGSNDGPFSANVPNCAGKHGATPGTSSPPPPTSPPPPPAVKAVPCNHVKGTHRFNCSFYPAGDGIHGGTPVVNSASHRVGYLNQGTNFIYCQQAGGELHNGQFFNKWWAYTEANDKHFGWVNAVYAHGGGNDGPFSANVPNCSGTHGATPGTSTSKPKPPPPVQLRRIHYDALGDSYSAGEGLSPYVSGSHTSNDKCDRSTHAWPELAKPGLFIGAFHFYACSGATTRNITTTTQYGPEGHPQSEQPGLNHRTDLVTLTIGGNDIGFASALKYCAGHHSCNKISSFTSTLNRNIAALPVALASAYNAIRSRISSQTTVVVMGYPQLFPEKPDEQHCFRLHGFGISLFDDGEQNYFNHEARVLDGVISKAAARAGFFYVSAIPTFRNHAQCASGAPYLNGITISGGGAGSFHPNSAGHRAYADLLLSFIALAPGPRTRAGLPQDPAPTG